MVVAEIEAVAGEEAGRLAVDGLAPRFLARPATPEALAEALRRAQDEDLAVVARGAGTKLALGLAPRRYDLALDLGDLRGLLEYRPDDLVAVALAGTPLAELQRAFAEHGQWLALDPPHAGRATLGGVLAANSSGPHRFRYGTGRDLVLGMRVAYPGGTLARSGARVVKSVAGYDLHKLHVGALGTLGVIAEVALRLHPLPRRRRLLAVRGADTRAPAEVLRTLIRLPLGLGALEVLDAAAVRRLNLLAGSALPERSLLLALCEGMAPVVDRQAAEVARAAALAGGSGPAVEDLGEGEEAARLIAAVSELPGQRMAEETVLKIGVPPGESCAALDAVGEALRAAGAEAAVHAHGGSGVVYAELALAPADVASLVGRLRAGMAGRRGHLVVQACPAAAKAGLDVWGPVAAARLVREMKAAFDPRGLLNPGRYTEAV